MPHLERTKLTTKSLQERQAEDPGRNEATPGNPESVEDQNP